MARFTRKKRALEASRAGEDRNAGREALNMVVLQLPPDTSPFALGEALILEGQRAGEFEARWRLLWGSLRLLARGRDAAAERVAAGAESQIARLAAAAKAVKKSARQKKRHTPKARARSKKK